MVGFYESMDSTGEMVGFYESMDPAVNRLTAESLADALAASPTR